MKDKPIIKYAVAIFVNGNEEYMRETHGDDCFTDDIGNAIIYEKWTDIPKINMSEYTVEVEIDEEGGMLVLGKLTVMPNMDEVVKRLRARMKDAKDSGAMYAFAKTSDLGLLIEEREQLKSEIERFKSNL